MAFSGKNPFDLLREILVLDFFIVEEFGSFRGIVDDSRDLPIISVCSSPVGFLGSCLLLVY